MRWKSHLEATLENYDGVIWYVSLLATSLITPLTLILFWPIKIIYSSYLTLLKRVFLITINLSQLFWGFNEKPKEKIYISCKQFNSEDLEFRLNHSTSSSYDDFETTFSKELNRHAPLKKKILQHSNNLFMTKELRKAIMLWSKLRPFLIKMIVEKDIIITDEKQIVNIIDDHFVTIIKKVSLKPGISSLVLWMIILLLL